MCATSVDCAQKHPPPPNATNDEGLVESEPPLTPRAAPWQPGSRAASLVPREGMMPAIVECINWTPPVLCCGTPLRHLPPDQSFDETVLAVLLPGRALSGWPHVGRRL